MIFRIRGLRTRILSNARVTNVSLRELLQCSSSQEPTLICDFNSLLTSVFHPPSLDWYRGGQFSSGTWRTKCHEQIQHGLHVVVFLAFPSTRTQALSLSLTCTRTLTCTHRHTSTNAHSTIHPYRHTHTHTHKHRLLLFGRGVLHATSRCVVSDLDLLYPALPSSSLFLSLCRFSLLML